MILSLYIDAM